MEAELIKARAAKVAAQMREHGAKHFRMDMWLRKNGTSYGLDDVGRVDLTACGTTACFAGHAAAVMHHEGFGRITWSMDVAEWLGIDNPSVFYVGDWTPAMRAVRHIHFVEEDNPIDVAEYLTVLDVLDDVARTGTWLPWAGR